MPPPSSYWTWSAFPRPGSGCNNFPHQFSGGMRQRVMIAIALASNPQLLLADEPTTALDVTIQDQILKLILRLKDQLGMSVILVTHDLGVVAQTCDRVAVMYAGRIVEVASVVDIFRQPRHAYTLGLLNSVPTGGGQPQTAAAHSRRARPTWPTCRRAVPSPRAAPMPTMTAWPSARRWLRVGQDRLSACIHHDRLARPREVTA